MVSYYSVDLMLNSEVFYSSSLDIDDLVCVVLCVRIGCTFGKLSP